MSRLSGQDEESGDPDHPGDRPAQRALVRAAAQVVLAARAMSDLPPDLRQPIIGLEHALFARHWTSQPKQPKPSQKEKSPSGSGERAVPPRPLRVME
jgi:hypothetical protein